MILAAALGLARTPEASASDLTIVFRVRGISEDRVTTHYYSVDHVRFDQGDEATVIDLQSGKIVNVSNSKKQYSETTIAEIEQAMTSVSAEMERAMAGIPEALRHKMMGDAGREVGLVAGESRTVAGSECRVHVATLGIKSRMETCAAVSLGLPFEPRHLRNLILITAPIARGNSGINKLVEAMRSIDGLPLASSTTINLLGRKIETATEATEIRRGKVAPELFAIPVGYQKVESPFAKTNR